MNFFELIMSPFVYIIKQIFLFSYQLTGDYGTAIVLLSFAISSLLLPIFIFIEKAKKKDDAIKLKMKPLIDEIKRCYKGQERFYYIKTINRQHNYSSFRSLIPILSLLLQIPFFIAAYQFLENFEPLKGISFLLIKDLSQPDGLFGVINFLPIFMTLVNLLTAFYYTRNGNTSERKQMLIVAGIFLILLFNLPSGLVLYWTMNNVFSFFRLFITNREVFYKSKKSIDFAGFINKYKLQFPTLKKIFTGILLVSLFLQFNWAFNNNFDDIYLRIVLSITVSIVIIALVGIILIYRKQYLTFISQINIKPQVFFSLLFISIYFHLASKFYFTGENTILGIIAGLFLIPVQFFGYLYSIRLVSKTKKNIHKSVIILLYVLLIYQLVLLGTYITGKEITLSIANISILINIVSISDIIVIGIVFMFITAPCFLICNNIKIIKPEKSNYLIYILSVLFILGLIFFWKPLLVYASSPETFDFPAINILYYNYRLFLIGLVTAIIFYVLIPKKYKKIILYTALISVVLSFIYSLVIPIQLGSLQVSQFSEQDKMAAPIMHYLLEALLLISIFIGVRWVINKKYFKVTTIVLLAFNVLLIGQSIFSAVNTGFFYATLQEQNNKKTLGIPFSKDKQNILYFLADGFQGWHIRKIMEEEPELKKVFDGFVWYPNTVSISNYTHTSLPSLFAGLDQSVTQMNIDSTNTTKNKITDASLQFMNKIREQGYSFSSSFIHYAGIAPDRFDNFIPFWDEDWKKWSIEVPLGNKLEVWRKRLYENALFYSVPLFLKPKIYNNTEWLAYYKLFQEGKEQDGWKYSYEPYNFIRLLPHISVVNDEKPNFIFIHDHSLHNPWNTVNDFGEMKNDVTPFENNMWFIKHFARWIKWMKDKGVYDNTKIVIISDHGVSWGHFDGGLDIKPPASWTGNDPNKISLNQFWRLNALLMVKDFNNKGDIKEDWRLMSNADAPSIILDVNNPTKNDSSRTLPSYITHWEGNILQQKKVKIHKQYKVKDNIFDLNNWELVKRKK